MASPPRSLFLQSVQAPRTWEQVNQTTSAITRARIYEAMATAVAAEGYARVTVADVVKAGRFSRRTFYEHFKDKEECFVETYRAGCENGIAQMDAALRELDDPGWRTRLEVSMETYVTSLGAEPHFARVLLIDVLGAGARALEMRERILENYVQHHRELREFARQENPDLPAAPDEFLRGLVGGIESVIQRCLLDTPPNRVAQRLHALTPTLVSFASTLLTGIREVVA